MDEEYSSTESQNLHPYFLSYKKIYFMNFAFCEQRDDAIIGYNCCSFFRSSAECNMKCLKGNWRIFLF